MPLNAGELEETSKRWKNQTYYEILGLTEADFDLANEEANTQKIKQQFPLLCRSYHPDKVAKDENTQEQANACFRILRNAYDTLLDPAERKKYNETLKISWWPKQAFMLWELNETEKCNEETFDAKKIRQKVKEFNAAFKKQFEKACEPIDQEYKAKAKQAYDIYLGNKAEHYKQYAAEYSTKLAQQKVDVEKDIEQTYQEKTKGVGWKKALGLIMLPLFGLGLIFLIPALKAEKAAKKDRDQRLSDMATSPVLQALPLSEEKWAANNGFASVDSFIKHNGKQEQTKEWQAIAESLQAIEARKLPLEIQLEKVEKHNAHILNVIFNRALYVMPQQAKNSGVSVVPTADNLKKYIITSQNQLDHITGAKQSHTAPAPQAVAQQEQPQQQQQRSPSPMLQLAYPSLSCTPG